MLPRDDLDLIDALVYCGAISRATAKELAATAEPGRVATRIMERGYMNTCQTHVIVERLAKYEQSLGVPVPIRMPGEQKPFAPNVMSCVICLQRDAAVGRGGCAECLSPNEQPETD
jgi:hypothetical protein